MTTTTTPRRRPRGPRLLFLSRSLFVPLVLPMSLFSLSPTAVTIVAVAVAAVVAAAAAAAVVVVVVVAVAVAVGVAAAAVTVAAAATTTYATLLLPTAPITGTTTSTDGGDVSLTFATRCHTLLLLLLPLLSPALSPAR